MTQFLGQAMCAAALLPQQIRFAAAPAGLGCATTAGTVNVGRRPACLSR